MDQGHSRFSSSARTPRSPGRRLDVGLADARSRCAGLVRRLLDGFTALGRGEHDDARVLLSYSAVPLLLTTDEAVLALKSEREIVGIIQRQVEGMRATGYDHSELPASELSILNPRTAIFAAEFSRQRSGGSEIGRLAATYVITAGEQSRRISALIVRTRETGGSRSDSTGRPPGVIRLER